MAVSKRSVHVAVMRKMLRRCRIRSLFSSSSSSISSASAPPDVPAGHVAVRVGSGRRRYVVPAGHLNHPALRDLLWRAGEEYGFDGVVGPICLPCDESAFEDAVRSISSSTCCCCCLRWWRRHVARRRPSDGESKPLLRGATNLTERSAW